MRLRTLLLAACLAAMPLSSPAFADDDIPTPQGVDMGPSPVVDPSRETDSGGTRDQPATGDAASATADDGTNGSTFDGTHADGDQSEPTEPGGTHVEPNGDP